MLGKRIHDLRRRQELSRKELAEGSGLTEAELRDLEDENGSWLPMEKLMALAQALKLRQAANFAALLELNGLKRRVHLYVLGLVKTGSVSLCGIFGTYRVTHEYLQWETHQQVIRWHRGQLSREEMRAFLLDRDARAALELDAAHFNRHYCDILAEEFDGERSSPPARFIYLLRDPYSWVESHINYFTQIDCEALHGDLLPNGLPFDLPRGAMAPRQELIENFCRYAEVPIAFWASENRVALQRLQSAAPNRSLLLYTHEVSRSLPRLAEFAGVPSESLLAERCHSNRTEYHVRVLHDGQTAVLQALFDHHCGDLLEQYFPGYRLEDYLEGKKPPAAETLNDRPLHEGPKHKIRLEIQRGNFKPGFK